MRKPGSETRIGKQACGKGSEKIRQGGREQSRRGKEERKTEQHSYELYPAVPGSCSLLGLAAISTAAVMPAMSECTGCLVSIIPVADTV